jgi:hypothetical protein
MSAENYSVVCMNRAGEQTKISAGGFPHFKNDISVRANASQHSKATLQALYLWLSACLSVRTRY